jgi:hypothetical protein
MIWVFYSNDSKITQTNSAGSEKRVIQIRPILYGSGAEANENL